MAWTFDPPRAAQGNMRRANSADVPLLVELMAEFYAESGYPLNQERAATGFTALLYDERLGSVWILQDEDRDVGYLVTSLRYAMEYCGLLACLDDLYVRPDWRNRGLGKAALLDLRNFCQTTGVRAMTVEVAFDNGPAQAVYRRAGFTEAPNRQLLALELASPTHIL